MIIMCHIKCNLVEKLRLWFRALHRTRMPMSKKNHLLPPSRSADGPVICGILAWKLERLKWEDDWWLCHARTMRMSIMYSMIIDGKVSVHKTLLYQIDGAS